MGKESGQIISGCTSKSSAFEAKKEKCDGKKEEKKSSGDEMHKTDDAKRKSDGGCVCRNTLSNSSFKRKEEGKCSDISTGKSNVKKPKCDSSQEAFKKEIKESGDFKGKKDNKCNTSYADFIKGTRENPFSCKEESAAQNKCQDSYLEFTKGISEPGICTESSKSAVSSSIKESCPPPLKTSADSSNSRMSQGCAPAYIKLTDTPMSTKICNVCKEFPKKYVKHDLSSTDNIAVNKLDSCCTKEEFPTKKHPCPPTIEAGIAKGKVQKVTCPKMDTQPQSTFFPLDVRNGDLNKCIEKYVNVDPRQVTSKCSQFANVTVEKPDACTHIAKKISKDCAGPRQAGGSFQSALRQSRQRQLVGRWAPSATAYLAATAALTVWVTEWKEPFQFIRQTIEGPNTVTPNTANKPDQ